MAALTIQFHSQDPGHVSWNIFIDGNLRRRFVFHKTELTANSSLPYEDLVLTFMQEAIKAADAQNLTQARAAIEARTWSV